MGEGEEIQEAGGKAGITNQLKWSAGLPETQAVHTLNLVPAPKLPPTPSPELSLTPEDNQRSSCSRRMEGRIEGSRTRSLHFERIYRGEKRQEHCIKQGIKGVSKWTTLATLHGLFLALAKLNMKRKSTSLELVKPTLPQKNEFTSLALGRSSLSMLIECTCPVPGLQTTATTLVLKSSTSERGNSSILPGRSSTLAGQRHSIQAGQRHNTRAIRVRSSRAKSIRQSKSESRLVEGPISRSDERGGGWNYAI